MQSPRNSWRIWAKRSLTGSALVGSLIASYAATSMLLHHATHKVVGADVAGHAAGNPFAADNGTHLIAFVVTASDCAWASRPEGMKTIRELRGKLRSVHGRAYAKVSVIGVSLDDDVNKGVRFLESIAQPTAGPIFDQIIVGGSWLNEQIVRFVWRERVARAVSPQILVIERGVDSLSYASTFTIGVQNDTIVANPTGLKGIIDWIRDDLPITIQGTH